MGVRVMGLLTAVWVSLAIVGAVVLWELMR